MTISVMLRSQCDVLTVSASSYTMTMMPANYAPVDVFLNGILQTVGVDYTLSGQTITFLYPPDDTPLIQVRYWVGL